MASFAQSLIDRRVPHVLAVYLGGSWALVEFFAFLEDRFLLSPHLTNLVLALLAILLPSVVLFTWFHGRKGRDAWSPTEKVFIPLNVLFALVVLFIGFSGKELGAVTTTVTLEDEEGNAVERVVVKDEFRTTLMLFPPYSDTTDADEAWLGAAVFSGLLNELFQDMFLNVQPALLLKDRIREAGYRRLAAVPRSLKRSLTSGMHVPYFVDGEVERAGEGFRLTIGLHDTERGRAVTERVHEGDDLFALMDSASIQLRRDLGIPSRHIEETQDLPAEEHSTASMEAMRHFGVGFNAFMNDDYPAAIDAMNAAIEVDPGFADAAFSLYQVAVLNGTPMLAMASLTNAMNHLHRLPERAHYMVKGEWYSMRAEFEKAFAVYEMWAELYPADIMAWAYVEQIRMLQGDRRGRIEALERILDLDPLRLQLLPQVGALYAAEGEPEMAREYYRRHMEADPENTESLVALARLHRQEGELDRARELYERAELLEPGDIGMAVTLAGLDRAEGHFDAALDRLDRALADAATAQQRYQVLLALDTYHSNRGQRNRALEYFEEALDEARAYMPPVAVTQLELLGLSSYVAAGQTDRALARIRELESGLQTPQDALVPVGKMSVYAAMGRTDELAAAVEEAEAMLEATGFEVLRSRQIYFTGRLHELNEEWEAAIEAYEQQRELEPTDTNIPGQLGRCYRELGDLERAEALLLESLAPEPADGRTNYELARVYEAMGRTTDAIRHLEQAVNTWTPADPGYRRAVRAREMLERLRSPEA